MQLFSISFLFLSFLKTRRKAIVRISAKFCNISRMLTSKDPRDSLFQEGSSRFLFGRGLSCWCSLCVQCFPPWTDTADQILATTIRDSHITPGILFIWRPMQGRSLRAATLGSRFTPCAQPPTPLSITYPPDPARLVVIKIGRCTRLSLRYCARAK